MKVRMRFDDIMDRFKILKILFSVLVFILSTIGLAGIPEDIFTWGMWLKKVLPLLDYFLGMILGMAVTVLAYETSPLWIRLFKQTSTRPDISLTEVVEKAGRECGFSTFDVLGFGDVLWNAIAGDRITTWGRELVTPGCDYVDDPALWPNEEKIPREYWKFNKIDMDTAGYFAGTSESTYEKEEQKIYGKLRFNAKQLENAGIFNSDFQGD